MLIRSPQAAMMIADSSPGSRCTQADVSIRSPAGFRGRPRLRMIVASIRMPGLYPRK